MIRQKIILAGTPMFTFWRAAFFIPTPYTLLTEITATVKQILNDNSWYLFQQWLQLEWKIGRRDVGSTNITNVTTLGVVISLRQMSQPQSQHQQQTSNNDKCHRSFSSKNNKRHKCHKVNASIYYNALWTTDTGISIPCRLVYCL